MKGATVLMLPSRFRPCLPPPPLRLLPGGAIQFPDGSFLRLWSSAFHGAQQTPVGVEKLFSRDFANEIRSQVIECSFAAGAEIHTNYCFGSFFNSHACPIGPPARETA